jgi:hypothetical protein
VRVLHSDEEQVGVEPVQRRQRRVGCLPSFRYCGIEDVCTAACDKYLINGACFKKDFANPDNVCLKCVPATNQTAFADTCPKCTPECKNGGICTGTTTRRCNCEGTNMVGAACDRAPVCASRARTTRRAS